MTSRRHNTNEPSGRPGLGRWLPALLVLTVGLALERPPALAQDAFQLERYQQRLESWFQRLDRNGDGRISPEEGRGSPFLEMNFQRLDRGRRGYLLLEDLAPARRYFLGERLREKFRRADTNGDGRLSPAEAAAFPWLERRFREADRNGDGYVTLEELWELRRSLAPRP